MRVFVLAGVVAMAACAGGGPEPGGQVEPDAGSGGTISCADTCSGCCTEAGACIDDVWNRQCGSGGELCTACGSSSETCSETGECVCAGCITGGADSECVPGDSASECGAGGAMCQTCSGEDVCVEGACMPPPGCTEESCPDGCCAGDKCISPGDADATCGSGGLQCQECDTDAGESCHEGECRQPCGPDNCTGCCIDEFTCEEDPGPAACGANGSSCEECADGLLCSAGGECVEELCENTCDGCCTADGTCIERADLADGQCGLNGASCEDCTANENVCADPGTCVSPECSASCQGGCCDKKDRCQPGDEKGACGADGNACDRCGPNSSCQNGRCRLDPNSRWNVVIETAEVPQRDENGDTWDRFGGLPDPFIRVTAGKGTADEVTATTDNDDDTTRADFDGAVVLTDVPARALSSTDQLTFVWRDADPFGSSEAMSGESRTQVPENLFTGELLIWETTFVFSNDAELDFLVRLRLVPTNSAFAYDPAFHTVEGAPLCRPATRVGAVEGPRSE